MQVLAVLPNVHPSTRCMSRGAPLMQVSPPAMKQPPPPVATLPYSGRTLVEHTTDSLPTSAGCHQRSGHLASCVGS